MAIESLSRYISQSGLEQESLHWETMVLKEIEKRHHPEVKSFFISQLYYFGSDASITKLSPYLTDPELQDPAIRALRDINPEKAADLFLSWKHHNPVRRF